MMNEKETFILDNIYIHTHIIIEREAFPNRLHLKPGLDFQKKKVEP